MESMHGEHWGEARWQRWLTWLTHQQTIVNQRKSDVAPPAPHLAHVPERAAPSADDLWQDWRVAGFNEQEWHRLRFLRWSHRRGHLTEFP